MIAVETEEMLGSDRVPDLNMDYERAGLVEQMHSFNGERNGALLRVHAEVCSKTT